MARLADPSWRIPSHHFCYPHSMKARLLLFSLLVLAVSVAKPQATKPQVMTPNLYELTGGTLHITYSTTSKNGQPFFSYDDGSQKLTFKGQEIQEEKSAIGVLVTVRTHMTTDAGSTTFTLLLPIVRLEGSSPAQVHTYGITTAHKFSVLPTMNLGQIESYTTTELSGTAELVIF